MEDHQEVVVKPVEEFWIHFAGITPSLVGPKTLQLLVSTKDDVMVMPGDKSGSWKPAAEYGFVRDTRVAVTALQKENIPPAPSAPLAKTKVKPFVKVTNSEQVSHDCLSMIDALAVLSTLSPTRQVTIVNKANRVVQVRATLAYNYVRFDNAKMLRGSENSGFTFNPSGN